MSKSYQIIGICGRKFNGKDTIADYMVKNYCYTKISLGDPIKRSLQCIFGFTDEQLWGSQKETIDNFWKVTPREMLQYFGTDCFRIKFGTDYPHIGNNIWVMALHKQIEKMIADGITKIVVPDLRFPNEETVIREFDGIVMRVIRDDIISSDTHASENSLNEIHDDYTVKNTTIPQLYNDIDEFMKSI